MIENGKSQFWAFRRIDKIYNYRGSPYLVISVLRVRVAAWCEMRIFLDWCESLCPRFFCSHVPKFQILLRIEKLYIEKSHEDDLLADSICWTVKDMFEARAQ